ncbi:hypothetical protein CTI12_AA201830 [Artemisia annua]|uniref:Uncharacterized protein n=1 Tax=Artemisia annua TaxID=35608 RepID=A0A2U1P2D1_ARTAN|nr:hypothetical protein CTI12_AA496310 [Artemisia annua]PWA79908.1 hypothetical protein CTI12_AA201830 [Artemisia annua]
MTRRLSRCLSIAKKIGDRRVDKVLCAIFEREERAYMDAEKNYNEMVEEVEARREYRHGLIVELMKIERDFVLDECLAVLRAAEQEDFAEISRLIMMGHSAALRAGEKGRIARKLRKLA